MMQGSVNGISSLKCFPSGTITFGSYYVFDSLDLAGSCSAVLVRISFPANHPDVSLIE